MGVLSSSIWVLYRGGIFLAATELKASPTCFILSARTIKSFCFVLFSFMAYANLVTSPKSLETELTNITRRHFCFVLNIPYLLYLLSLIGIFSVICLFWHTLTACDDTRTRHGTRNSDANSRAKTTTLYAIFCRGNKSSSCSLARFCRRKHKKSTARASRSGKNWAQLVGKSSRLKVLSDLHDKFNPTSSSGDFGVSTSGCPSLFPWRSAK